MKIIVGFAPGGGDDITARFMAQRLSLAMGQQFIVDNKPGAGGAIGTAAGVNSPPDGYMLTLISAFCTVHPSIYKLRYDPVIDVTPIIQVSQAAHLIVVHPSLPARSIAELVALARSKPGKLNYATPGQGGTAHLATELFASMSGIKLNHIPYKGTNPALSDTIGGQTDLTFAAIAAALPHVRSGKLRARRSPSAPDVPTVAESGVPGYEVVQWYGLIGPKGLPSPIVARINGEVAKVLESKDAAEHLRTEGMSPVGGTPEQLLALIKKEIQIYRKVATDLGLKAE